MRLKLFFLFLIFNVIFSLNAFANREKFDVSLLEKHTVAVTTGSVHEEYVTLNFPKAKVLGMSSMGDVVPMVVTGKAKYGVLNMPLIRFVMQTNKDIEVIDDELHSFGVGAIFNNAEKELLSQFNAFLEDFMSSDTFKDMKQRWHVDGTGGDIPIIKENKKGKPLKIAISTTIAPAITVINNKIEGFDIELIKHFALAYNYSLHFEVMNFGNIISSVASGGYPMGLSDICITPEREAVISFSEPYNAVKVGVIAKKGIVTKENDLPSDVAFDVSVLGKSRVAVTTATTHDHYMSTNFPQSDILRLDNMGDVIPMVLADKADYGILDTPLIELVMKENGTIVMLEDNIFSIGVGAIFSPTKQELLVEFNDFLREFMLTDTFKDMSERWRVDGSGGVIPEIQQHEDGKPVIVAISATSPPASTIINNEFAGFDIELVKHFAWKYGYKPELVDMSFAGLLSAVAVGKADIGISDICITAERQKSMSFSLPYSEVKTGIFVKKALSSDSSEEVKRELEVIISDPSKGATQEDTLRAVVGSGIVAAVEGTAQENFITPLLAKGQVAVVKEYSDAIVNVESKKSDYLLTNKVVAASFLKQSTKLEIAYTNFKTYTIHFGVEKGNDKLCNEINAFLAKSKENGLLEKLQNKWFVELDDGVIEEFEYDSNNKKVLKVGTTGTAVPFSFVSQGKDMGLDIELMNHFCKEAGYKLELVKMPFGALVSAIVTNKVDVIANTLIATKERKEKVDFTDAYATNSFALVGRVSEPIIVKPKFFKSIGESFYNNVIKEDRYLMILNGLWVTFIISVLSIILGTFLGGGVCCLTMGKSRFGRNFGNGFITLVRGTPILVLLMINFYVVFAQSDISPIAVAVISFGMNFAAYVSEMFRAAIQGIDKGQTEAGLAMGFSKVRTFFLIVAPQAIKRVMPVFKGEAISLGKMTSVVGYIAVQDLTKISDIIRSRTFDAFFPLLVSALLYFLLAYVFTVVLDYLASKLT